VSADQPVALAAEAIREAEIIVGFTGAGISVESGIPPFRGKGGLWNRWDPSFLEIRTFFEKPLFSWKLIREIFYDFFGKATPNPAHRALAAMERAGLMHGVITQNIDNLHQQAGSHIVHEFHGSSSRFRCTRCGRVEPSNIERLKKLPLYCIACGSLVKPDFIFFGEGIPEPAGKESRRLAERCDAMLVIGTSGEVMPACSLPYLAKEKGATIIEVNPEATVYTGTITDIHLQGPAGVMMKELGEALEVL
jgi:NAD-dependent deacetylase